MTLNVQRAKTLKFDGFAAEPNNYIFKFIIDDTPYEITLSHSLATHLTDSSLQNVLFHLGMCYLIDLAEITVPDHVFINFSLSDVQLSFWQTVYQEVAKEKMFIYKLDLKLLESDWSCNKSGQTFEPFSLSANRTKVSLCLTGGKESLTLLKLLKNKADLVLFFLNPETNVHRQRVFDRVKDEFLTVKTVSNRPQVLKDLKHKYSDLGSGVDMAHLVFNSILLDAKYVVIGNEYSSNFPNFVYQGYPINHQYVKSLYFAQKLNRYLHQFVTKDFSYHSPFFGLYEYKIAQELFRDEEYLEVWTSCNQTTETVNFCSNCHKCAFTYLVGLLYTSSSFLTKYFSRDMLQDVELYRPLMDFTGEKPLDCVGEKIEVWTALEKVAQQSEFASTPVVLYFNEKIRPFIAAELPKFEKEVNTVQTVAEVMPAELENVIQEAYLS